MSLELPTSGCDSSTQESEILKRFSLVGTISVEGPDDAYYNTSIPLNITDVFSSFTDGTTMSGPFDIQFRSWTVTVDNFERLDKGQPFVQGSYRSLDTLILHNATEAVEGVIVDTVNAGVGYRNHSAPKDLPHGGEWSEDITWIEPVTECVDTNLTFEIKVGSPASNITNIDLVDNGGFVNAPAHFNFDMMPSQDPDLKERALRSAIMSNTLIAYALDISSPNMTGPRKTSLGQHFKLNISSSLSYKPSLYSIKLQELRPDFITVPQAPLDALNSSKLNSSTYTPQKNATSDDWNSVQHLCQGGTSTRQANTSNIALQCGYLFGAPRPTSNDDTRIAQPFSTWTQSLYVCSSSVRASIKSVALSFNSSSNGNSSLENLRVRKVTDKTYDNNSSAPLWGVERTFKPMSDVSPLWGPVAEKYALSSDLTTFRGPKFYLPGTNAGIVKVNIVTDSLAAPKAFAAALLSVYEDAVQQSSYGEIADYTGKNNVALNKKWQDLSLNATSANKIINLIYTEIIATAMVGTKSSAHNARMPIAAARAGPSSPPGVAAYARRLHYNWRYGVPAALVLLVVIIVAVVLLACLIFRFKWKDFTQLLNQTSTGRVVTNFLDPYSGVRDSKTEGWLAVAGGQKLQYPFRAARLRGDTIGTREASEPKPESDYADTVSHGRSSSPAMQDNSDRVGYRSERSWQQESEHGSDRWHRTPLMADPGISAVENEVGKRGGTQVDVRQL